MEQARALSFQLIYNYVNKLIPNACILTAPTGIAAFSIGGVTLHRAFKLPVEYGKGAKVPRHSKLSEHSLSAMRQQWQNTKHVIIDKISVVSEQTLQIHLPTKFRQQCVWWQHKYSLFWRGFSSCAL